jgi:hypothetical protein
LGVRPDRRRCPRPSPRPSVRSPPCPALPGLLPAPAPPAPRPSPGRAGRRSLAGP